MPALLLLFALFLLSGCDASSSRVTANEGGDTTVQNPVEPPPVPRHALMDNGTTSWIWERRVVVRTSSSSNMTSGSSAIDSLSILDVRLVERIPGDTVRLIVAVSESTWFWRTTDSYIVGEVSHDTVGKTLETRDWSDTLHFCQACQESWPAKGHGAWSGVLRRQWSQPPYQDSSVGGSTRCPAQIYDMEGYEPRWEEVWTGEAGVGTARWRREVSSCGGYKASWTTSKTETLLLKSWQKL